jgi:hypothetical protein
MDPYLEQHWRDVHASLIIYARDMMQPKLPGDLFARVEERVFLEAAEGETRSMYPDVRVVEHGDTFASDTGGVAVAVAEPVVVHYKPEPVDETFIEIIDAGSGNKVITVIEFLSVANKNAGEGQDLYLKKQDELKRGRVSLVEVDLLREGKRILSLPARRIPKHARTPYQVCVRRGWTFGEYEVYPVPLRQRLPAIRIPLRQKDNDISLDLQELIDKAYLNGRYQTIDYSVAPEPPLGEEDMKWAIEILRQAGKRT